MSTLSTTSVSLSTASKCSRRILRVGQGSSHGAVRIHTGRVCRQEPKQKDIDNEPWAMPSPSTEAGPSRQPAEEPSHHLNTSKFATSTPSAPSASSPVETPISIPSSSESPSRLKFPDRLPKWIPPHWQTHLQPDAQWRKELLNRRKRLAEQAGQQLTGLGLKLNEVTGYKEVERLKELVEEKETRLRWLREDAKTAKEEYERAVTKRATTQSDVNSLLERKHAWSDEDVSRFTQLVRSDHSSNQAVTTTAVALKETEIATDKAFSDLMQAILQRYHEEQVWSDKIRNVSTYAGLAGLLVNLVVFVGAIAFVEPWKRKRLVERLEDRIEVMMGKVEGQISGLGEKVEMDMAQMREASVGASSPSVISATSPITTPLEPPTPLAIMPLPTTPLSQSLERISPYLDRVAPPSRDRDIAFSAGCGAVLGITATAVSLWLGR